MARSERCEEKRRRRGGVPGPAHASRRGYRGAARPIAGPRRRSKANARARARLLDAMRYVEPRRRQALPAVPGGGMRLAVRRGARARADGGGARSNACTATRWRTTTCRRWTTTTCGAAARPRTRRSTRPPPSWRATGCSRLAFDILSRPETHPDAEVRLKLVSALARASGLGGMVGGQMLDLAAEGRFEPVAAEARRAGRQDAAGDEDRCAAALRLRRRRHPRAGRTPPSGTRSTATAQRSVKRSRSPTTCSISKAIRPRSARPPARTRPRNKATLVGVLGPATAKRRLEALVAEAESALAPFGSSRRCAQGRGPLCRNPQRLTVRASGMPLGRSGRGEWYSWVASNHRPPVPQTGALTI